jgi:hypothetical protein
VVLYVNGVPIGSHAVITVEAVPPSSGEAWRDVEARMFTAPEDGVYSFGVPIPWPRYEAARVLSGAMGVPLSLLGYPSAFDARYRQRQRNRVKRKNGRRR